MQQQTQKPRRLTDAEEKRLDALMAATYSLTKPERKQLRDLLAKRKS